MAATVSKRTHDKQIELLRNRTMAVRPDAASAAPYKNRNKRTEFQL